MRRKSPPYHSFVRRLAPAAVTTGILAGVAGDDSTPGAESLSAGELQRRAISGSAWTAVNVVVTVPVAFVANAIVARSLGVGSYGHLAFLTATLGLATVLANFGFSNALIQQGSRAVAGG